MIPESMKRFSESVRKLFARFRRDESGNYLIIMGVAMPALVGAAGLGTEEGYWLFRHHLAQSAADAAAISAATGYSANTSTDVSTQAKGVAAQYGFVSGQSNLAVVTVNRPPTSGTHKNQSNAVEVYVQETRTRLLSGIFGKTPVVIKSRAVAVANGGLGCMLSLDRTALKAGDLQGNPAVTLTNCTAYDNSNNATALNVGGTGSMTALSVYVVGGISGQNNITTTKGIVTGANYTSDPYANTTYAAYAGCNYNNLQEHNTVTLNHGVYCNGLKLLSGAVVTLNAGTYYFDRGTLDVAGGATLKSNGGVTLVFTSSTGSNYATAVFNGGSTISLTAPSTGSTAGIVMFGDRHMPLGTVFKVNGGAGQGFGGAIYLPEAAIQYAGGAAANTNCTQVIGDTIAFVGNSMLAINCASYGTQNIGSMTASLAE